MNDIITVCGIVATEPRHLVTETGIAITSLRLASPSRRWDRATAAWVNGATNWYTVTAFRSLASNVFKSLKKGDRIVVAGRVRIRTWERDGRGGTSVEIDADGIGHDLAWGISNWVRVPRQVGDAASGQSGMRGVDPRTGEVREPAPDTKTGHPHEHGAPDPAGLSEHASTEHGPDGADDGLHGAPALGDGPEPAGSSERVLDDDAAPWESVPPPDDQHHHDAHDAEAA
ncbi:single-stranded DNA-binding protein [Curtobacterium sp. VKM Ac-1376]|uniref:single-stranded DNA-binding protein n=1 Tax=Curtobacterium sp. VKM Ac-1376 TaxID=123312 RepID=UPI001889D1DF|nr:single-stranded DNA-binding protein [Curtobacterium sp. VKM Ac-1376]MBF4614737.1 single-stranded DNA-binding protein [Curtobacterium sp. VKM Ac-1376]